MNRRVQIFVTGRVQGVFFRASTQREANRLGVYGYVGNCPDGRVEVIAEGAEEAVEALIGWCRSGPSGAHVDSLEVIEKHFSGQYDHFSIAY